MPFYTTGSSTATSINATKYAQWIQYEVWPTWVTASNKTTSLTVWANWSTTTNTNYYIPPSGMWQNYWRDTPVRSPEQQRIEREAAVVRERQYEEAGNKAWELLKRNLTDEQVAQLEQDRYFELPSESGLIYRFRKDGLVERLSWEGRPEFSYCIHPDTDFPVGDQILTKKLMLQHDEARFLKVANARQLYTPTPRVVEVVEDVKPSNVIDVTRRILRHARAA